MVSLLVVGCGSIGRRHLRLLLSGTHNAVSSISICELSATARANAVSEFGLPAQVAFEDMERALLTTRPDAVVLCTPPELHVSQALLSLKHGACVLMEKPLSDSLAGVPELIAARDQSQRVVMVALCFRFHAGVVRARQLLTDGVIGELVGVRAMMGEPFALIRPAEYKNMFVGQPGSTGAFDLIHDVDLACWFASAQRPRAPTRVRGLAGCHGRVWPGGAPDTAEVLIDFRATDGTEASGSSDGGGGGGVCASVHLDFFQSPRRRTLELLGSSGVLILEFGQWEHCSVRYCNRAQGAGAAGGSGTWTTEEMDTDRDDMFVVEQAAFLDAVAQAVAEPAEGGGDSSGGSTAGAVGLASDGFGVEAAAEAVAVVAAAREDAARRDDGGREGALADLARL
eukprot:COSAG01_NODE_8300_length_2839_cov_1.632482_1_plen_398_part_00